MFPLYDNSRQLLRVPYVTFVLIAINILVFLATAYSPDFDNTVMSFGLTPDSIMAGQFLVTLITSMFLHASLIHLLGNMWFLWIFGRSVEDSLGKWRYILLYSVTGILAGLAHTFSTQYGDIPAIGASGAISGVLGAYLILFPRNKIRAFMLVVYYPLRFNVPAYLYMPIWFLYQFLYIASPTSIAYGAHIGGFIAGLLLALILNRHMTRKDYLLIGNELIETQPPSLPPTIGQ